MMKTSIWALNGAEPGGARGGVHWRVSYPGWPRGRGQKDPSGSEARLGVHRNRTCVSPVACVGGAGMEVDVFVANVRPIEDGNHVWEGVVPFMNFEPGRYARSCPDASGPSASDAAAREDEFNQPSTWVLLRKSPEQIRNPFAEPGAGSNAPALLNDRGRLQFGSQSAQLEMENARVALLGSTGLHAIARAQTYYHRPGNWAEQPNFFNPYWRSRLASVFQGRRTLPLIGSMVDGLPPPLNSAPQKLVTH